MPTDTITIEVGAMLRGFLDDYAEMSAPEEDVLRCRQHTDALLESLERLADWRKRNGLPVPDGARGISTT